MVFKAATFHGVEPEVETEHYTRALLEAAVSNVLAVAGGIDASEVNVTAVGDDIVLGGTVCTVAEIERATVVAQSVEGVRSVRNQILLGRQGNG
jgi:osmotically-inducible protein OsmY